MTNMVYNVLLSELTREHHGMIEITTLGNLDIKINGVNVSDSFRKTTKLLQLLNLFIINRSKPLPIKLIYEVIFGDDYDGNEYKALQNLIYRLRGVFAKHGASDCIIYKNQTYMLNPALDLRVDIYIMEDSYMQSLDPGLPPGETAALLRKAAGLYKGEYMLDFESRDIYLHSSTIRYKRLYVDVVCKLADLYIESKDFNSAYVLCDRAIAIEPLEEPLYLRMICAMRSKGMDAQAIGLIEHYYDILDRKVGVKASGAIFDAYNELKHQAAYSRRDVDRFIEELKSSSPTSKALLLDFENFKEICKNGIRHSSDRDYLIALALIEINGKNP